MSRVSPRCAAVFAAAGRTPFRPFVSTCCQRTSPSPVRSYRLSYARSSSHSRSPPPPPPQLPLLPSPSNRAYRSRPAITPPLVPASRSFRQTARPQSKQPADDPSFVSIIDNPPTLVRSGRAHGWGLYFLAIIPVTAFFLGTWQVQRLDWKAQLIAKLEDRLLLDPLPLPLHINPAVVPEFDYRRVTATGIFRHDQEMLVGPRVHEGQQGYLVVTPLERPRNPANPSQSTTILVNRGWISSERASQRSRPDGLVQGEVTVEGLLREPWQKNMFTPDNQPERNQFFFPDVQQMAQLTGSQPIWVEETTEPEYLKFMDYESRGIPIARAAAVQLRNNHAQYIVTWYGLAVATTIMFWMVAKKPPSSISQRVRLNKQW